MVNLIKVKRTLTAVIVALTIHYCVRINVQVRKQNMLEHILKGTSNTVVYIKDMCCIQPATMEKEQNSEN